MFVLKIIFTLCNIIAIKTIISTSVLELAAAAPRAIPSAFVIKHSFYIN
jgi:hypothetical protein